MKTGTVQANGIGFSYRETGDGPLVLLLHGFPDNGGTWDEIMQHLAAAGFRAVAPNTRGYAPTDAGDFYDSGTLATDAKELIRALGAERAHVVGHDWGAATTFYLAAAFPEVVDRAVALALPHPRIIAAHVFEPENIHRAFHFWFFQMQFLPEGVLPLNDFAFIDFLYRLWSPSLSDAAHIADVKATLAQPGVVTNAIAYYRAMFDPARQNPETAAAREALGAPITVPVLNILGAAERGPADPAEMAPFFANTFRLEMIEGAGHFVHREKPDEVAALIVEWLKS